MGFESECQNDTELDCGNAEAERELARQRQQQLQREADEWIEEQVAYGFKMWHLIFFSVAAILGVLILLCCCVKFRIPRTKQEIEGDYVRRKILRKFRRRLKGIQNQELDDMDLKKALDKIRAEFKSDTESLAQSEAGFSGGSSPGRRARQTSTYRRASQIAIDISLEDLRAQSMGLGARLMLAVSRLFGRSKVSQTKSTNPNTAETATPAGQARSSSAAAGPQVKPKTPPAKSRSSTNVGVSVIQLPNDGAATSTSKAGITKSGVCEKSSKKSESTVKLLDEKNKKNPKSLESQKLVPTNKDPKSSKK